MELTPCNARRAERPEKRDTAPAIRFGLLFVGRVGGSSTGIDTTRSNGLWRRFFVPFAPVPGRFEPSARRPGRPLPR